NSVNRPSSHSEGAVRRARLTLDERYGTYTVRYLFAVFGFSLAETENPRWSFLLSNLANPKTESARPKPGISGTAPSNGLSIPTRGVPRRPLENLYGQR